MAMSDTTGEACDAAPAQDSWFMAFLSFWLVEKAKYALISSSCILTRYLQNRGFLTT